MLVVVVWIGSIAIGGVSFGVFHVLVNGPDADVSRLLAYFVILIFEASALGSLFYFVSLIPTVRMPPPLPEPPPQQAKNPLREAP